MRRQIGKVLGGLSLSRWVKKTHALSVRTARRPNNLRKALLSCLAMLTLSYSALAQNSSTVAIPRYGDKYSKLVRQLEAGQTNINYREFRDSFLESEQFKVVGNESRISTR
jgi:hypothetical protein